MESVVTLVEGEALKTLSPHPLAELVPSSHHVSVRGSIQNPVVLVDGWVLDGRARIHQAISLDIPCPCITLNATRDDHPALIIARAMTARQPEPPTFMRAIVCARLVRAVLARPRWLDRYDFGMATRLKNSHHLDVFLHACDVSRASYYRAHTVIGDVMIERAVMSGLLSLKLAERLLRVPSPHRVKFIDLPAEERAEAIEHYLERHHRHDAKSHRRVHGMK
ncbi:hypothetical protein [Paraburkholderia adhaesiva]|uniref:hypothetical protein n=1 Tax=Paraburkholderia adhaesiva TaxID=2883244 RepID=UPI001F16E0FC|nr:hypothetical protein [Paraburkholderia adhaesiva]